MEESERRQRILSDGLDHRRSRFFDQGLLPTFIWTQWTSISYEVVSKANRFSKPIIDVVGDVDVVDVVDLVDVDDVVEVDEHRPDEPV